MHSFTYTRAQTAEEAVRAVAAGGPGTRFLAGGTTLYDLMKLEVETPTRLVDVTGLEDLSQIDTAGSAELAFGAMARMSDVAADPRLGRGASRQKGPTGSASANRCSAPNARGGPN